MRKAQHAWRTGLIVPFPLKWLLRRLTSHLRQQGPREHTPTLRTLISHLLFICTSKICFAFSRAVKLEEKKRQLTYAPDAHNLSESCHVSARSDPSLSHHAYQNTTWARHAGQRGEIRCLALTLRQTDSQPGRHTDKCQNTRPTPPVVRLMKGITLTQSLPPTKSATRK